jgi:hypothetical protein
VDTLIRRGAASDYWLEVPSFAIALLVAEVFYKFGSFSLELLAFLPTWYAAARVFRAIVRWVGR